MGGSITDVAGILVGHAHDVVRGSGVTVLLFPEGAMAVADIRGEAPGTRQMDSLLRPHPVQKVHALVFAGGSAFGLDAASGVVRHLEAHNIGFSTPGGIVLAVATGASGRMGNALQVAALGTRALEKAIVDAVRCAKGNGLVPAAAERQGNQGREDERS